MGDQVCLIVWDAYSAGVQHIEAAIADIRRHAAVLGSIVSFKVNIKR